MEAIQRMHLYAETFARQLGCGGYDTRLAEQDFRAYLESQPDPDYPQWGARASWTLQTNAMNSQSGTGNPLSPLFIVGSELSSEPDDYQALYFKFCFDLLWKELFDITGSDIVRHRVRRAFLKHWGGAGKVDNLAGYNWAPFYKGLRYLLMDQPEAWSATPFVARHMNWHTKRDGGHQWNKASIIIKWIQGWPVYPDDTGSFSSAGDATQPFHNRFTDEKNDDFAFFSECSLEAAAAGKGKGSKDPKWNEFILDYALNEFKQKRIYLLNPGNAKKGDLNNKLRDRLRCECEVLAEWKPPTESAKLPNSLWRHRSGNLIVFAHKNLTSNVSNYLLADLIRLIRKAARLL